MGSAYLAFAPLRLSARSICFFSAFHPNDKMQAPAFRSDAPSP